MSSFFIPYLPAGLNVLLRKHWTRRSQERDTVAGYVWNAVREAGIKRPRLPVRIIFERFYASRALDPDNAAASAKYVLDALVREQILPDDTPAVIEEFTVKQTKVGHRKDQGVRVTIEEM